MIYKGRRTNYGEVLGILMMESYFPRIPGDIGNATTFSFPVRYEVIKGATISNVVEKRSTEILELMIEAAKKMEEEGVRAITGSCGFLAIWQKELSKAVSIPVFTSSLLQVQIASTLTGGKPVGIITASKSLLTDDHFAAVGVDSVSRYVYGLDDAKEFNKTHTYGGDTLNFEKISEEIVAKAVLLKEEHPEVGSIVVECTNVPPYSSLISEKVGIPVFDIITLCNYVYSTVIRRSYNGWL